MKLSIVEAMVDALFYMAIFLIVSAFIFTHIIPPFKSMGSFISAGFKNTMQNPEQLRALDQTVAHLPVYIRLYALISSWDFFGVLMIVGVIMSIRYFWKKSRELQYYG